MLYLLKSIPRSLQFAPRVNGKSIVLVNSPNAGEAQEATINDAYLVNDRVTIWDATSALLKATSVSGVEISYLQGTSPGQVIANRALVVDSNRDLTHATSRIRNLTLSGAIVAGGAGVTSTIFGSVNLSVVNISSTLSLQGSVRMTGWFDSYHVVLNNVGIRSKFSSTDYDVVQREGAALIFGNTSDDILLSTGNTKDLIHKKGSVSYKIWDESNGGAGSGLDADKLDSYHASSFVRTDASSIIANPYTLSFGSAVRQMLNLYGVNYGLGVQSATLYCRSGEGFAFFKGGSHSDETNNAGSGGVCLLRFDSASFVYNGYGVALKESVLEGYAITVNASGRLVSLAQNSAFNKNFGTSAGTITEGNDNRLSNSRQCNNYFDNASSSRVNLGLGNSATRDVGGASNQVAAGDHGHWYLRSTGGTDLLKADTVAVTNGSTPYIVNQIWFRTYTADTQNEMYQWAIYEELGVHGPGPGVANQRSRKLTVRIDRGDSSADYDGGEFAFNATTGKLESYAGITTTSDIRLKKDISPLYDVTEKIKLIGLITYRMRNDSEDVVKQLGVSAQNLKEVFPELVDGVEGEIDDSTKSPIALSVSYDRLAVIALKAIQELDTRLSILEKK